MQQARLEGWMVRQIENADLAKETVIQLPVPKHSSTAPPSARITRPPAATPRRIKGGVAASRRSVVAVAGQEMSSSRPPQSPRPAPVLLPMGNNRDGPTEIFHKREPDESVEKLWRAQFHDRRQPCIEGVQVDRTKVLHNMLEKQQHGHEEQSPLFLWGLPREHILDFIRQSVLPSSWANTSPRLVGEWEAVPNEEDEAARVRCAISNALASAPAKATKKPSSPRAPSPPRSSLKSSDGTLSPLRGGGMSPRSQSVVTTSAVPSSPRSSPRSEERIQRFIAELRADPTLWAAFQHDVEQIQQQYRLKNYTSDKIRENKERARTPRSIEAHDLRKKQAAERMERTQRQREQIVQLEGDRLAAKREAYLRRVNPTKQLSAAEVELTVRYRRRKVWLYVVSFAAISHRWHQQLMQTKHLTLMTRVERTAASTIQRIWRKWKWQHASKHTVIIYTWLRKCLWKLLLRIRCRRKARHATLLQQFMLAHFTESNASRNFNRLMVQWRGKVIRAQKAGMSFILCNRARLQALSIWWDNVDHERQRMDRQLSSNVDDGRRLTARRDSIHSNLGSTGGGAPGSAGTHRKSISQTGSIALRGAMDEKLANMQMLLTPIEIQRLQQTSVHVVKIPKSIKWQLLTEFLNESRKEFRRRQQAYREMVLCASYAREVKLEEARAIVQSSVKWDGAADRNRNSITCTGSISKSMHPPPCFSLFSNPNGTKLMEALVRRGVQLTLDADPELRVLVTRQQEHRLQSPHTSPRRPSVSFSGGAGLSPAVPSASPLLSPSPRSSILKKPSQRRLSVSPPMPLLPSVIATNIDKPSTPPHQTPSQATTSGRMTPSSTRDSPRR
ncbi:hypothetical protein PHYPSEUDO_002116 [Phytophthora pseudosyringae]|uniref:Uncharacterized protein n=1 Tax=Phytophthora pseudosyringae TaxID=221518 RepID=A0A8T1VU76_9STRA|nr:hypothetical protein PHYPSEUDO_002116 [Phytophthora pseudosyringae]